MEGNEQYKSSISYDAPRSDGEDEYGGSRLSSESARYDHQWLQEEQDQDRLLSKTATSGKMSFLKRTMGGTNTKHDAASSPDTATESQGLLDPDSNGRKHARRRHGRREVIHKIEEGGSGSSTPASDASEGSSEVDRENMGAVVARKKSTKRRRIFGFTILHVFVAALFVAIAYGAYHASVTTKKGPSEESLVSNGTSLFAPTTIYISLDGFRADYLRRGLSPTLSSFIKQGVSPKYMTPSFPSLTFPNHYTLVTGLYPESHGIVANSFWDVKFREGFMYTSREHSMQSKWWDQNPLWETAELQGVRAAIHMWPGSEAHIGKLEPTYVDKFNGSEALSRKVDRVFSFLDKPGPKDEAASYKEPRPQLIAAYVPDVDSNGHKFGPNSTEVNQTISAVDDMLDSIFTGLEDRNLTNIVNIVIVSDHGMATTDNTRLVQFEDIVDEDLIEHIDGWPHYGLRPENPADLPTIHQKLVQESHNRDGFDVYLKDEDMPERYHFANNERIAPLWIMAHTGWAIVTKEEYDVAEGQRTGKTYHPQGIHGYDNEDPLMRAIFVARGPAFPHEPGSRLEPFQNTEVYNIICDSIGIEPHANNGTLRLPLVPVGLHGDEHDEEPDHIAPPATEIAGIEAVTVSMEEPSETSLDDSGSLPVPSRPAIEHNGGTVDEDTPTAGQPTPNSKQRLKEYWEWVKGSLREFAQWAKEHIHHHEVPP